MFTLRVLGLGVLAAVLVHGLLPGQVGDVPGQPGEIVQPQLQPGSLAGRSGALREKLVLEGGGNAASEVAVALGLQWLALHQSNDGSWSLTEYNKTTREKPLGLPGKVFEIPGGDPDPNAKQDDRVTATAFALLPFLGAGQTHKVSKEEKVDYSKTVRGGLDWLLKQQTKEGVFAESVSTHALATVVVCEAYGMTNDPMLKASAMSALKHLLACQHEAGGWHETPKTAGDLTVTGWAMTALTTAQLAGLAVPKEPMLQADRFLESVYDETAFGFKATRRRAATASTTAFGMLCKLQRGINPRHPVVIKGSDLLKKEPPAVAMKSLAYALAATQTSYHVGGNLADLWNLGPSGTGRDGMRDLLIKAQDKGDNPRKTFQAGSWASPEGESRVISTAQCLLMLEVYYRHLPMYRRDLGVIPELPK